MIKILVTGAGGQLGSELRYLFGNDSRFKLIFTTKTELDITDATAVDQIIQDIVPQYCINAAAYTAVDQAENHKEKAYAVNVKGAENMARACLKKNVPLFHFSTDYVYHTRQNRPYQEGDATMPRGVYAKSKFEGDNRIQEIYDVAYIIRTSWVYSSFGLNFVKTMLRLSSERDSLKVVYDQIGSPTYAADLAQAVLAMITHLDEDKGRADELAGVYHFSNEGVCSWYDFAKAIFEIADIDCAVHPIKTSEYPTPAERPPFSVLDKEKIKSTFDFEIPHWRDSLRVCLSKIEH